MLHIFMYPPTIYHFQSFLRTVGYGDDLLLLSDGVTIGIVNSVIYSNLMISIVHVATVYALKDDVISRGLFNYLSKEINIVDYIYFVTLTEKHKLCVSW